MKYKVRYHIYYLEALSAASAKQMICRLLRENPEKFISIEDGTRFNERRPLWRRFLTGA